MDQTLGSPLIYYQSGPRTSPGLALAWSGEPPTLGGSQFDLQQERSGWAATNHSIRVFLASAIPQGRPFAKIQALLEWRSRIKAGSEVL